MEESKTRGVFDFQQDQVDEVIRNPLQNHDRMDSGRRYCLLITVHKATRRGCQALPKAKWNPARIVDMMKDYLDVMEAVILYHIATILYVGRQSAGEGLTEEEAEACIEHFSSYIKWREVAIEREFQALMLAEGREEIQAYEAQSQKSLGGWGRPRVAKPPSPIPGKIPIGLNCSPQQFQQRVKGNWWVGYHSGKCHLNPGSAPLDRNNSASSRQLP